MSPSLVQSMARLDVIVIAESARTQINIFKLKAIILFIQCCGLLHPIYDMIHLVKTIAVALTHGRESTQTVAIGVRSDLCCHLTNRLYHTRSTRRVKTKSGYGSIAYAPAVICNE